MVAVHPSDMDGASRTGMRTAWIDRARARLRREVEGTEQLVRSLIRLGGGHPEIAPVVGEHLAHREEAVEVDLLRGEPDQQPGATLIGHGIVAEDADVSTGSSYEAGDHPDQRRLGGGVGTEKTVERAGRNVHVKPL